jgi:hypothetical protein
MIVAASVKVELTPIVITAMIPTKLHLSLSSLNKNAKIKTKTRFEDLHMVYSVRLIDLREVFDRPMSNADARAQGKTLDSQSGVVGLRFLPSGVRGITTTLPEGLSSMRMMREERENWTTMCSEVTKTG